MPGKCKFNELWLNDENFKKWLTPASNVFSAFCKICKATFDISHSGVGCVKTHAKGVKHKNLIEALITGKQTTISFNFPSSSNLVDKSLVNNKVNDVSSMSHATEQTKSCSVPNLSQPNSEIKKYMLSEQVTKAEIVWALQVMLTHTSSRGGGSSSNLFRIMFPDSIIADKFHMQKDKLSYMITYGLGPYFQEQLSNNLRKLDYFCISIDESLNKVAQKGQMDVIVRFWDNTKNIVQTQYLTSMFLGHSRASDLLDAFTSCLNDLGLSSKKLLQVETDGPNVNLKFLKDFDEHMKNEHGSSIFDIGTCSLHVVHGCYKTALVKSEWNVNEFLRAAYYLFKDFPSRRADYQHFSGSSLFPLKLCAIRWIENSSVIERAIQILPALKLYINAVKSNPPATKNFKTVSDNIQSDKLLLAKLYFLQSVTSELETFLILFQSEKPLLPHLYEELSFLFKKLSSRILKKDTVSVKNERDILLTDLKDKNTYLPLKQIDIGFGATTACSEVSENDKIVFLRECRNFLINFLEKLKVKSPLSKLFLKGLACLSPQIMLSSESVRSNRVTIALKEFIKKEHVTPIQADAIKNAYLKICEDQIVKERLKAYDIKKDRLDAFLIGTLQSTADKDEQLLIFIKKILTMFHGNAAVERSFSINKQCLVENLEENSLVAQRCVYSAIAHSGGVGNLSITPGMLAAVRGASGKRKEALQQKKMKQTKEENEKLQAAAQLKEMKKRKLLIIQKANEEIELLEKEIVQTEKKIKRP